MKATLISLAFCSLLSTTSLSQELSLNMPIIQTKYTADPAPIYTMTLSIFLPATMRMMERIFT